MILQQLTKLGIETTCTSTIKRSCYLPAYSISLADFLQLRNAIKPSDDVYSERPHTIFQAYAHTLFLRGLAKLICERSHTIL